MSNMSEHTKEAGSGLSQRKVLKLWEIAVKSFRTGGGQIVDIEHASDADFQAWIASHGIPVNDKGIATWSFLDRAGVINHALWYGVKLSFAEDNTSAKTSDSEVFEAPKTVSQAG